MRRRERIRQKTQAVDSTTALDLTNYACAVKLQTRGQRLWDGFVDDTPFWWDAADLPMVNILCAATDAVGKALTDTDVSPAGRAAIVKEWRSLAAELGLSPTSRGRLKMTEAQASRAAKKVEAMEDEHGRRRADPIDIDDLTNG